jgi:excisionase family DNA binding protein
MKSKPATRDIQKRLLTIKEAAVYLGRSVCGVRELIWAGKLPYVRFDRRIHLDIHDLEKFIEENKTAFIY